jgi:hypothetical protein
MLACQVLCLFGHVARSPAALQTYQLAHSFAFAATDVPLTCPACFQGAACQVPAPGREAGGTGEGGQGAQDGGQRRVQGGRQRRQGALWPQLLRAHMCDASLKVWCSLADAPSQVHDGNMPCRPHAQRYQQSAKHSFQVVAAQPTDMQLMLLSAHVPSCPVVCIRRLTRAPRLL